jgi:SAM-dependent methyltransferase
LPWDYGGIVRTRMQAANSLLDLGTGGGEFLASLAPFPANAWTTEGYPPDVSVARKHLEPTGGQVVDVSDIDGGLPFEADSFDLVIDRHTGYEPREVHRVLRMGGRFLTQQVGGEN